jgi:uncharacterized membrane protein
MSRARPTPRKSGAPKPSTPPLARGAQARIGGVDALRGGAICAMIVYHFSFDLNWFGVFRADFNHDALWLTLRALIVSSFLLLVGASLVLAQRARVSPTRYWRRIALITVCALLVTTASYFAFPQTFITFGILHCIAVSSVLAWPLVRHPLAALCAGIAIVSIGLTVRLPLFDMPWLNWVGLMTHKPVTEDYVPVFPWLGVVCIGIALGAWLSMRERPGMAAIGRLSPRWLTWAGRHSLLIYMVHQPVLVGLLRIAL